MNTVNKLLTALNEDIHLKKDEYTIEHRFISGQRQWIANILPAELLTRSVKEAVESLVTMSQDGIFYDTFPDNVETSDYGDKWGVSANYIEINNRAIAMQEGNQTKNGILSSIKILPAIPPSAKSWANCIILSQIFPNIYGDGINKPQNEENSIYGIKLNSGYSKNIIVEEIKDKLSSLEQFKAFNDLAHFHGLKTGFRTVISAGQIKIAKPYENDIDFNWDNPEHTELFIKQHVDLINCGFEAIFVDSAKHIGNFEMENYAGVGALPNYRQMQYITHEIRLRTKNTKISFVGEKTNIDFQRYENLGFSSGTGFVEPDDFNTVRNTSMNLKYHKNYTPGIEVSNDNDEGGRSYEARLNRIHNSLFAYEFPSDKMPSFMQTEDIFPLRYDTNTHRLMMSNPSFSTDGSAKSHWENLFAKEDGREYNKKVAELFVHSLNL